MSPVLLDTGVLVALLDRSEKYHEACAQIVPSIESPLVTCEAVITEACYLLRTTPGAAAAVLENVDQGVFLIPYRLQSRARRLSSLLKKYSDVPMDFADATLVVLAEELSTRVVLTTDRRDFGIYRIRGRGRFRMLPCAPVSSGRPDPGQSGICWLDMNNARGSSHSNSCVPLP